MPHWDDQRGHRYEADRDRERDRWRRDQPRERGPGWGGRGERRSFGDEGRDEDRGRYGGREDWRRERRFEPDRTRYGRNEDAGAAGYRRRPEDAGEHGGQSSGAYYEGEPLAYGGQEYGMESHGGGFERGGRGQRQDQRQPRPGPVGDRPAPGYGQARRGAADHEFDPDYLRWREEQLRGHDRDYQEWRRLQRLQYDEQYRQFRAERQRHFGEAFHEWRSQRSAMGSPTHTATSSGSEFGSEPPQVQANADGEVQGQQIDRRQDEDQAELYGEKPRR